MMMMIKIAFSSLLTASAWASVAVLEETSRRSAAGVPNNRNDSHSRQQDTADMEEHQPSSSLRGGARPHDRELPNCNVFTPECCATIDFSKNCRRKDEGETCGECTCYDRTWVCNASPPPPVACDFDLPSPEDTCSVSGEQCIFNTYNCPTWDGTQCTSGNEWNTYCTCNGAAWDCDWSIPSCAACECEFLDVQIGGWCPNANQECRDNTNAEDCTCTNGVWTCTDSGSGSLLECDDSVGSFFECTTVGEQCVGQTGNCPVWDGQACVPGTDWEQVCECQDNGVLGPATWLCDAIPICSQCPPQ